MAPALQRWSDRELQLRTSHEYPRRLPAGQHGRTRTQTRLGPLLIWLKDGHATWLLKTHAKACVDIDFATRGTYLCAVETSDAGVCTKGKPYRPQDGGQIVGGSKKYFLTALGGITTAYRKAVLSGREQRHLYSADGVTQKLVTIAKA